MAACSAITPPCRRPSRMSSSDVGSATDDSRNRFRQGNQIAALDQCLLGIIYGHLMTTSLGSLLPYTRIPFRFRGGLSHVSLATTGVITWATMPPGLQVNMSYSQIPSAGGITYTRRIKTWP